jgi:serine protease Do
MRGVNLNVFEFDYDLTWAAFFLTPNETVYGRFGGRDANSPDKFLTLAGLKHSMRAALDLHANRTKETPGSQNPKRTVEQYAGAKGLKQGTCIHCHQVFNFARDELRSQTKWTKGAIWTMLPPEPARLGFVLDPERGNHLLAVPKNSPAAKIGLQAKDVLRRVCGLHTASFADVQHALWKRETSKKLKVEFERDGKDLCVEIDPPPGWRESDISWRPFMWGLEPSASVYGKDLSAAEKKKYNIPEKALAFYMGDYVPEPARQAGIRKGDIILGIDDKKLEMTMLQFNAWIRLNYTVGQEVTYNIIRKGKRMNIPMELPKRG